MEQIDRLTTISKTLFDQRVSEQRQEIEKLKKESVKSHYLYTEVCQDGYTNYTCVIPAVNEIEAIKRISGIDLVRECFEEENYDLRYEGKPEFPSIIDYIENRIKNKEVFVVKLDEILLGVGKLYTDPKHHEGQVMKSEQ